MPRTTLCKNSVDHAAVVPRCHTPLTLLLKTMQKYLAMSITTPYPAETNSSGVTSWIPLTTVWTPPSGCNSAFLLGGSGLVAFDIRYGMSIETASSCQLPEVTSSFFQGLLGGPGKAPDSQTYVSLLSFTCPDGFSTVVTSVKDVSTTEAMCCPS